MNHWFIMFQKFVMPDLLTNPKLYKNWKVSDENWKGHKKSLELYESWIFMNYLNVAKRKTMFSSDLQLVSNHMMHIFPGKYTNLIFTFDGWIKILMKIK